MLARLVDPGLRRSERALGASLDYLRHIARVAPSAFAKFSLFTPLSGHRKHLPAAPYHLARIAAVRHEDCGTCLQIEANLAAQDGVDAPLIRAAVRGQDEALPDELRTVTRFARAVAAASGEEEQYRADLLERYGEAGMVELALGIATSRVFPSTKRALGYATACSLVTIDIEG